MPSQTSVVGKVIAERNQFNGKTDDQTTRKNLITLIFLVSEAARCFSLEQAMRADIESGTIALRQRKDTGAARQKSTQANAPDVVLPDIETTTPIQSVAKTKWNPRGKGKK